MLTLKVGDYFTAEYKNAEFSGLTSSDRGDRYNPNPKFFQELVDNGIEIEGDIYDFPAHEIDVDFPWFSGYLHIVNGVAYVISTEFDCYCRLSFAVDVLSEKHLTEIMEGIISVLQVGYNLGFDDGEQAKQAEIRKALGV